MEYALRTLLSSQHAKLLQKVLANFYASGNKAGKLLAAQIKQHKFYPLKAYYSTLNNLKDDSVMTQPTDSGVASFLNSLQLPQLTKHHLDNLNAPFSVQEIEKAIISLPNGKAPGPDGFSGEYYKIFSTVLIPHLRQTFNAAVSSGKFPNEMLTTSLPFLNQGRSR